MLYALWPPPDAEVDQWRDGLLQSTLPALARLAVVSALRLAVADSAVAPAAHRRLSNAGESPAALLTLWVNSADDAAQWEPLIAAAASRMDAYLVAETEPLVPGESHPAAPGERRYGMCQVVFMNAAAGLERQRWLHLWQGRHTAIAVATQATFGYRQNLVLRQLGSGGRPVDAIVEEHFPPQAMASDHAFYATGGDEAELRRRRETMMQSCANFIDFGSIEVLPMSEYRGPRCA